MRSLLRSAFRFSRNLVDSPAVILLYHRVIDLASDPQQLAVSPKNFDAQIDLLKKKYSLLDITEFTEGIIRKRKLPRKSVIVSFDDGYADNLYEAIPILERHRSQALFYISTSNLDTAHEFWWDNLERIFLLNHPLAAELQISILGKSYTFNTSSSQKKTETYHALHPLIKDCVPAERDKVIDSLITWAGLRREGRQSHRVLTTDELIRMSGSAAAVIGAHTHNHPKLSVCSEQEQREEIATSKDILAKLLQTEVSHFSYPFGSKTDYTQQTVRICRETGFSMVCSNYHDQVHSWHSPMELPRMLVRNWPVGVFEQKMHNFFNF